MNTNYSVATKELLTSSFKMYQRLFGVTQENIAQKDVEGYITQTATIRTESINGTTYGVKLTDLRQKVNEDLFASLRDENNKIAKLKIQTGYRLNINKIFGDKETKTGLSYVAQEMTDALTTWKVNHKNKVAGQDGILAIQKVTQSLKTMTKDLQSQRANADADIAKSVQIVNSLLDNITTLNSKIIIQAANNDGADFPLLNQRRELLQQLSAYVQFDELSYNPLDVDHCTIYDLQGNTLVSNDQHVTFSFQPTFEYKTNVTGNPVLMTSIAGTQHTFDATTPDFSGGVSELLKLRDQFIPTMQQELDTYAVVFCDHMNALHNQGIAMQPQAAMVSTSYVADGSFPGPGLGSIALNGDTVLSGVGTLRIATVDVISQKMSTMADFVLTDGMTLNDFISQINNANIGITASLDAQNRFALSATTPGAGIIFGAADEQIQPKITASTTFNPKRSYGFSHFFGFNNLINAAPVILGDQYSGISEVLSVRADILQSTDNLCAGVLDFTKQPGDVVLNVGDTTILEKLSTILQKNLQFPGHTNVLGMISTLETYSTNMATRYIFDAQTIEATLKTELHVFEGLSLSAQEESGVDEQAELNMALMLSTSLSYVAKMISLQNELDRKLLEI